MVLIQVVTVLWTKTSRGGPWAEGRSRLPFEVEPPEPMPAGRVVLHAVTFDERDFFADPRSLATGLDDLPPRRHCVSFRWEDDGVAVEYEWREECGAPPRRGCSFVLQPGQSGRVITNGRLSGEDHWRYQQITFTIWNGAHHLGPPAYVCDRRERLR